MNAKHASGKASYFGIEAQILICMNHCSRFAIKEENSSWTRRT